MRDGGKNIFYGNKKMKNDKTKNVSSVVLVCNVSIFCNFIFPPNITKVELYAYDLTQGMAPSTSSMFVGERIEGT